jgi:drug/metabolite transporter (DMT)-like permease
MTTGLPEFHKVPESKHAHDSEIPEASPSRFFKLATPLRVPLWLVLSTTLVLTNSMILSPDLFPHPTTLALTHQLFASIVTRFARKVGYLHPPQLAWHTYTTAILPIGLLFGASLVANTLPYLTLSVSFMQMLKGLGPGFCLFAAWTLGLEALSRKKVINIGVIVFGVVVASVGEVRFEVIGVAAQLSGLVFEAYRLGLTRRLLDSRGGQEKIHLSALDMTYYLAPVCTSVLACVAISNDWNEMRLEQLRDVGCLIFAASASLAFCLNLCAVQLVSTSIHAVSEDATNEAA